MGEVYTIRRDMKPLITHHYSTTGEFNSPRPKYLRAASRVPMRERSYAYIIHSGVLSAPLPLLAHEDP
eukprot:1780667-Pyramimonas_sp.AAC.1